MCRAVLLYAHQHRVILHCVQFVLLLALLVAEVVIQQHQLLTKSGFGAASSSTCTSSSSNGNGQHTLPVTQSGAAAYQRLPGSAAEAGDKQWQQQQQQHSFKAWCVLLVDRTAVLWLVLQGRQQLAAPTPSAHVSGCIAGC